MMQVLFLLVALCCATLTSSLRAPYSAGARAVRNMGVSTQTPLTQLFELRSIAADLATDSVSTDEGNKNLNPLKLIIAGAPAAGKGTQCENIKDAFDVIQVECADTHEA